ncbi:MAG: efflux RND transporter periplasmic adaptor subunit [Gammaproteobacteria bacterium]|nr:efflux RND transporter periplasmic adaptor subunit [Gammaproteobacteria bacterium]MDE1887300.1 efflux RND transporter periplasmic adaptor subunit [Gammaproteobacteria bacterium]MDE2022737.1 efflux RND transporter periplasmic adaptor subunit [Gammaproteobacteria bacterium]MDE2138909.1 efflux RND transporter periplasmic adaptor subunit [Gammaproteobacteria bacterium]MDE2274331.1 efflux RND transporter periplasmic adaptor subunit [Gammaproteobacteria bacterium]
MYPIRSLFLTVAIAVLAACGRAPQNLASQPAAAPATVSVKSVVLTDTVEIPGTVIGSEHAELASRNGGQVTRVAVAAGQHVARGALLLEVDPVASEAALAEVRARAAAAHADAEQAERDFQRYEALYKEKAVSPHEFEEMQHRHTVTAAAAQAADTAVAAARTELSYAVIRAPFAGVVAAKNVRAGDYAAPGAPLIVLDGGRPQVEAQVGESLFTRVTLGEEVFVTVDARRYRARVIERVSAADPVTRTHLVKLDLPVDAKVASGAYASVTFPLARHTTLIVPASALLQRAGLDGVFVVNADGVATFRLVRAGATHGNNIEILAGLAAGERVVAAPGPEFDNGTRVAPANTNK